MIQYYFDMIKEMADNSDMIFCNEDEAEAFSKTGSKDLQVISEAIHKSLKPNCKRIVVITCGKDPVYITRWCNKNNQLDFIIKQFVPQVNSSDIVDTNGCGDAFVGGFLSKYVQGASLNECAKTGILASGVVLKNVGATFPEKCEI